MARYAVYSKGVLVGHSRLEHGDPPMGVAFGEFTPNEAYREIQSECTTDHADQTALELSVQTESGIEISCAGVAILDYSGENDEPYAEVNVLGITYPRYEELFPDHVARYDQLFAKS
jgi:hypothetical protein